MTGRTAAASQRFLSRTAVRQGARVRNISLVSQAVRVRQAAMVTVIALIFAILAAVRATASSAAKASATAQITASPVEVRVKRYLRGRKRVGRGRTHLPLG